MGVDKVQQLQNINGKSVLRYMILPGVMPRLREFAQNGFGWLALMIALIYQGVRLLPPTHPYCNPANMGRFGIRHVIAEAANNLVISRRNIDQIARLCGFGDEERMRYTFHRHLTISPREYRERFSR